MGAGGQALKLEPTSEVKIKTEHLKLQTRIKVVTENVGWTKDQWRKDEKMVLDQAER